MHDVTCIPDSSGLIDQSIADLERLSSHLARELPRSRHSEAPLTPPQRLSKEAVMTISVLVKKLRAVNEAHLLHDVPPGTCPSCED